LKQYRQEKRPGNVILREDMGRDGRGSKMEYVNASIYNH